MTGVHWVVSKKGVKVCAVLTDAEYQGLAHVVLTGLLAKGFVVTRSVRVSLEEFVKIASGAPK